MDTVISKLGELEKKVEDQQVVIQNLVDALGE